MTIKVVIPVSGGKDSQACLKLAAERYTKTQLRGLFCDTQFEHPLTYQHLDRIEDLYGIEIDRITAGSVPDKVLKYKRFPGGGARHCTDELKIQPSKRYYKALADKQGGFEVWYGMRAGESAARRTRYYGKVGDDVYAPHEVLAKYPKYLHKAGVSFRLPVIEWSEHDVLEFLGNEKNPLYDQGFSRVGCFPCLAGGDKWKAKAFDHDDFGRQQYQVVVELEKTIDKSIWTSKGVRNKYCVENPGCAFCSI